MFLSNVDIKREISRGRLGIDPLEADAIRENGVDLAVGREWCRLVRADALIDPVEIGDLIGEFYECERGDSIIVWPNERVLLHTVEYLRLPSDVIGLVNLRSTYARLGLYIPPTVVDAGFEGQLTIELIGGSFPVILRPGQRLIHLVLARLETPASTPYRGRYQGQRGVTLPRFPVTVRRR